MPDDSGKDSSPGATGGVSVGGDSPGILNTGTIIIYSSHSREDGSKFIANFPPLPHIHQPRQNEIKKVKKLLNGSNGNVSPVTSVRGWPGVGKTTFLTELAHEKEILDRFTDGMIWISLGQNPGTLDLLTMFATGLGFDKNEFANADINSLIKSIHSRIVQKKFLILIDDAWNPSHVTPFLFGGCECAILVATRSDIVAREISPQTTYTLDEMSEGEGMELLKKIAPSVAKKHGKECSDLLKQIGFLPLIIKITGKMLNAEFSRGHDVPAFINKLKMDSASIINAETPDDVQRESKSLLVSMLLDRSLALLGQRERRLFAMLSVFGEKPIHCDLDAIKAVWGVEDPEPVKDQLVDLGLLELESEGKPRYQMHALLVQYGYQLLKLVTKQHPEELRVPHIRHAEHYRKVLSALDILYLQGNESMMKALSAFDNYEWPNIQRAQQWSERNWKKQDGSADLAVAEILADFPTVGAYILSLRLHSRGWIKWHESALPAIEMIIKKGSDEAKNNANRRKGGLLGNLGNAYLSLGESRKAIEYHEQALEIAREIGARRGEGNALGNLGIAYDSLGEYRKAIEHYEQALEIAREIGDRRGEGNRLGNLGTTYASLGESRRAIEYHEQALKITREIGDRLSEGKILGNLGTNYFSLGEYRKAIEYCEQALKISREIGDRMGEGNRLCNLGNAYDSLGEYRKAIKHYEQALEIARGIGAKKLEGDTFHNLAGSLDKIGKTEEAFEYAKRALEIYEAIESPYAEPARKQRDYFKNKLGK